MKKKKKETPFLTGVEIQERKVVPKKEPEEEDFHIDDQDVLNNLKELENIEVSGVLDEVHSTAGVCCTPHWCGGGGGAS